MNRSEQVQGGPQVNKREQVWGSPSEQIEQVHMWIGSHMGRGEGDLPSGHMISPSLREQTNTIENITFPQTMYAGSNKFQKSTT